MKTIKILILFAATLSLSSCSRDLLNTNPETDKEVVNFYKTEAELEQAVSGAYSTLQFEGQYRIANLVMGEIPSDNTFDEVPANDDGKFGQMDVFTTTPANDLLNVHWRDHYRGIQQCNIILNRIDAVPMDNVKKGNRKGEALFLRALMYYNLVIAYGDVPLVTKETTDVNSYFGQPRTPKAEVYAQIENDLSQAATILPNSTTTKGRVTKGAAYALLGKVLLTRNNYADALAELAKVESLNYTLLTDPNMIFDLNNENNSEIIFDVQFQSALDGNTQGANTFQMFSPSGSVSGAKGHNLPTIDVYNLYQTGDKRKSAYIGITNSGVPFTKKLKKPTGAIADGGSNIVVLRYADVLLMIAECNAKLGNTSNALTYLNKIKTRAGIPNLTNTNADVILDEIANERRLELVGEGHRWYDLVRTGKAISVMNAYFAATPGQTTVSVKPHQLIFPVPRRVTDTDPAIVQNPGY